MENRIILLVEDNPDDRELILRAFRKHTIGNPVVVAKDGAEALDLLMGPKAYDPAAIGFVLLDLKLPKVDGLEVLRRLRANERTKLIPVVILTSSKEDKDLIEGYRLGTNSYVQKPIDFNQFSEAVRQVGLYWLIVNVPPPS
ncbi:MAG: response regulator [bacterium]|nr:response regulator [bacterium]